MDIRPPVGLNNILNYQGAGRYEDWRHGSPDVPFLQPTKTKFYLGEKLDEVEYLKHKASEFENDRNSFNLANSYDSISKITTINFY